MLSVCWSLNKISQKLLDQLTTNFVHRHPKPKLYIGSSLSFMTSFDPRYGGHMQFKWQLLKLPTLYQDQQLITMECILIPHIFLLPEEWGSHFTR